MMPDTRGPLRVFEVDSSAVRGLSEWKNVSVAGIRDAVLSGRILQMTHRGAADFERATHIFNGVSQGAFDAVRAGRVFDLGHLPNKTIMSESRRAGELYTYGHIGHPFRDAYVMTHTWEQGTAVYVIRPEYDKPAGGSFIVAELLPMRLPGMPDGVLIMGDAVNGYPELHEGKCRLVGDFLPAPMRQMAEADGSPPVDTPEALLSNLSDPMLAAMLLLATDGIAVERITPSPKLAKARAKNGKPPIPPYWRAETAAYVTALTLRGARRLAVGLTASSSGHHASPVPHLRKGHIRHKHAMHGGGTVFVRDALVLIKDGQEVPGTLLRSFYAVHNQKEET